MMDRTEFNRVSDNWHREIGITINYCPPEARVITGRQLLDARLYYLQQESGTELKISDKGIYEGYSVVDEKKYVWFLLRWS